MKKFFIAILITLIFGQVALADVSKKKENFFDKWGCELLGYFDQTEYQETKYIMVAQAILETGWGTAHWVDSKKQLFALKNMSKKNVQKPIDYLATFSSFDDSYAAQLRYYRKKDYPLSRDVFYKRLLTANYSEKKDEYIRILKNIEWGIKRYEAEYCTEITSDFSEIAGK